MRKSIFINTFILTFLIVNLINARDTNIDYSSIYLGDIIIPEDGNIIKYSNYSVLDSNLLTAIALKNKLNKEIEEIYGLKVYGNFAIKFQNVIEIDEIVIYNGYQKNKAIYNQNNRVKKIQISLQDMIKIKKIKIKNKNNQEIETFIPDNKFEFLLKDSEEPQKIKFNQSFKIDIIDFAILSTYPGTKYTDICISEIEFYNKGEKYQITNLEEAKREYIKKRVELNYKEAYIERWKRISKIENKAEKFNQALKKMGFQPDQVSYIAWILTGKKRGQIIGLDQTTFKKYEKCSMVRERKYCELKAPYGIGKVLGEWKYDEYGNYWIKFLKKEWKLAIDNNFYRLDEEDIGFEMKLVWPENEF